MKHIILYSAVLLIAFQSCKTDRTTSNQGISLMKYGFPISVNVEKDAEIITGSKGYSSDISIKKGQNFNIHIFMSQALSADISNIKQTLKAEVISNPYFIKMVEEYDDGFIYEKQSVNYTGKCYDFRWVYIQGEKEFVGQTAITGEFSEQDVKRMFNSLNQILN